VLAIPVEETIIYVEPIYLQSETAAYPELRLVVVMHNDNLSYAENFEDALQGIFGGAVAQSPETSITGMLPESESQSTTEEDVPATSSQNRTLIQQANQAFEQYIESTGQKDFDTAADELKKLQDLLQRLSEQEEVVSGGDD